MFNHGHSFTNYLDNNRWFRDVWELSLNFPIFTKDTSSLQPLHLHFYNYIQEIEWYIKIGIQNKFLVGYKFCTTVFDYDILGSQVPGGIVLVPFFNYFANLGASS